MLHCFKFHIEVVIHSTCFASLIALLPYRASCSQQQGCRSICLHFLLRHFVGGPGTEFVLCLFWRWRLLLLEAGSVQFLCFLVCLMTSHKSLLMGKRVPLLLLLFTHRQTESPRCRRRGPPRSRRHPRCCRWRTTGVMERSSQRPWSLRNGKVVLLT